MVLSSFILIVQSGFTDKLRKDAEKAKDEALGSKGRIESMMESTKKSIKQIAEFGDGLKHDVKETQSISKEIVSVFNEVSKSIEVQASSVNNLIEQFASNSAAILDEVTSISSITEENSASVEEVLASINQQNEEIEHIANSYINLQSQVEDLGKLCG